MPIIEHHRAWWVRASPIMPNYRYEKRRWWGVLGEARFWVGAQTDRPLKKLRDYHAQHPRQVGRYISEYHRARFRMRWRDRSNRVSALDRISEAGFELRRSKWRLRPKRRE